MVLLEKFWAPCSFGRCVGGVVAERVGNSCSLSEGVGGMIQEHQLIFTLLLQ